MKIPRLIALLFGFSGLGFGQTAVLDQATKEPVSFAAISFNNGNGIFADDEGLFIFNKKLYPDIDSLHVSSLGYKDLKLASEELRDTLYLTQEIDKLDEVVLFVDTYKDKDFDVEQQKPYLDDDYYKCWLPTIESEIAVLFHNPDSKAKKLSTVHIPIALESKDWEKRKKKNAEKKPFSTLFKVNFYANDHGFPGKPLLYETVVFRITEKDGDQFDLDVSRHSIFIPENGVFISIQVLGYTDEKGKLLPNKKYKEIKSGKGVVKIPTNFRPLLPFTNEIPSHRTFVKRVFIKGNNWVLFSKDTFGAESTLLRAGLNNYGMGVSYRVYED